jgi:hypothetical protein
VTMPLAPPPIIAIFIVEFSIHKYKIDIEPKIQLKPMLRGSF